MEKILLKHFYNHLYNLSLAYYSDQYSSQCYGSEIREYFMKAKTIKEILDECGIVYKDVYIGYCGYEIDLTDFEGW